MSNKTRTTPVINWPVGHFTVEDAQRAHPSVVNITLRFRVNKSIENKELVEIGKTKAETGRPKKVYARANPTKQIIEAARAAGVIITDRKLAVTVAKISPVASVPTVVPATASTNVANQTVNS